MQNFRNLKIWEASHQLVKEIYHCTQIFPKEETYGLSNQIRRACVSIPSNIAEGCGRGTDKDFARFVQIALGSASELEYQIFLAFELGYLSKTNYTKLTKDIHSIKKMLSSLRRKLLETEI
jgi:four helix bundle protein